MTAVGRVVHIAPGAGSEHRIGPDRFWTKGEPSQRAEAFSVVEYCGAPGVPGPPRHIHRSWEEAWYILEGEVRFTAGAEVVHARKGSYLYVPRGVPHTFEVVGGAEARWVGIFSPGRFVGLVEELGALIPASGPPDPASLRKLFAVYETDLVGRE